MRRAARDKGPASTASSPTVRWCALSCCSQNKLIERGSYVKLNSLENLGEKRQIFFLDGFRSSSLAASEETSSSVRLTISTRSGCWRAMPGRTRWTTSLNRGARISAVRSASSRGA